MNDKHEQEAQKLEKQEETNITDVEKSDIEVKDEIAEEAVQVEAEQVEVLVEQTEHEEKIEPAETGIYKSSSDFS